MVDLPRGDWSDDFDVFEPWVIRVCAIDEFDRLSFDRRLETCLEQISFFLLGKGYDEATVDH